MGSEPPTVRPHLTGHGDVGPGRPEETFRLHPLTPVALGGRILGLLAVVTLFSLAGQKAGSGNGPNIVALIVSAWSPPWWWREG